MSLTNRVEDLLVRSLAALEAPFPRLVFLASSRDPYSGRYLHEGWATVGSADEVHRLMQQAHAVEFQHVLDLSLSEICSQLLEHFRSIGSSDKDMAKLWLSSEPFRYTIPDGSSTIEREFFVSQLRTALKVLAIGPTLDVLQGRSA